MHIALRTHPPPDEIDVAVGVLGREHPLVAALDRRSATATQLLVVLAVLAMSGLGVATEASGAAPVALASAIVAAGLGCRLALGALELRDYVLELIVRGRGRLPLAIVQRERARLLDRTRRHELARAYESLGQAPDANGRVRCRACVVVVPSVMGNVRPELALIAALIRDDAASARGIAAAQLFIRNGTSSLFGRDELVLCQDLRRIAYLLCEAR